MAVAVSGGADSLALLLLARAAGLEVEAVHVDHGLRPGSAADAVVVRAAADAVGAAVTVRTIRLVPGPNLEARARAARYGCLPPGALVGHTADDQAETVLLNLLRGAGLDGLAAMAGVQRRVRRPILGLRRADTAELCASAGWSPVRDPANDDLRFRRNQIRHRLMPLMAEVAGRDPVPVLSRTAGLLAADAELLASLTAAIDPRDAAALAAAPVPLAARAVRRWLRDGSDAELHPPSAAEVQRVIAVARAETAGTEVSGGRRVRRSGGRLRIEPPPLSRPAVPT
ncbi:MAG: tRNA lysidine(34) synthetase TilS [Acidimicrobiales bacterium]